MSDEKTVYMVNGVPVKDPAVLSKEDEATETHCADDTPVEREAPAEGITDAEIEAFDKTARESFERDLSKHTEIRPGSKEAEEAIRSAIRGE